MSDWYYAQNGEQKGPTNESDVKAFLAAGQIPPETLVWKDGMDDWTPANQIPAFSFRAPPAPAKVQPTAAAAAAATLASPSTPITTAAAPAPVATIAPMGLAAAPVTTSTVTSKPLSASTPAPTSPDVAAQLQSTLTSITSDTGVVMADPDDFAKNKILGIIAYLPPLLFIVTLIVGKDSRFAKFHANQALIFLIAAIGITLVMIPVFILFMVLSAFTSYVWYLYDLINLAITVIEFGFVVLGIMAAAKGQLKPLPVIGKLIEIIK